MPFQQIPPDIVLPGFELVSATQPYFGESVNGDALFVETGRNDGAILLLLLDIQGHGPGTSVTMTVLRSSLLGANTYENQEPAELLKRLHGVLYSWPPQFSHVAALALLVRAADQVSASRAGHPEPWLRLPPGDWQMHPVPTGPPLGLPIPAALYQSTDAALPDQGSLLAFTDGVTEAGANVRPVARPQFQNAELPNLLAGLPLSATPSEVVGALMTALQNHVGPNWPDDDTTAVCLRRG
jgi:serine phosphatase RsbU (regulator of sigma subunit)